MVARRVAVPEQTVRVTGVPVRTMVTARPAVVRQWVYTTLWRFSRRRYPTVGLGVQWTPLFHAGADKPPAIIELCVGTRCLVYQIARAGGCVPRVLRRLLADRLVMFAGYNVAADCRKLSQHYGLYVASSLELRRASGMGNASMEEMADRFLGVRGLTKSRKVGAGNWDVATLSKKQVRYACVDAYLSCSLGVVLRHNDEASSSDEASP